MSIRWKIILAFSVPIMTLVVTALVVHSSLKTLQDAVEVVTTGVNVQQAESAAVDMIDKLREQAEALPETEDAAGDAELLSVYWSELIAKMQQIDTQWEIMQLDPELVAAVQEALDSSEAEYTSLSSVLGQPAPDLDLVFEHSIYLDEELSALAERLSVFSVSLNDRIEQAVAEERRVHNRPAQSIVLATILGGVLLLLCSLLFARMLVRPIIAIARHMQDIAEGEGDLTQRVDQSRRDEIGQLAKWFNIIIQRIHDVILEVHEVTSEVDRSANEIAAASEAIAGNMSEQTTQIRSVSEAIDRVTMSTEQVAVSSIEAAEHAAEAGKLASSGGKGVENTVASMTRIRNEVGASAASVEALGNRGEEIGKITVVINDIAGQTNLLALNAAIEAARAGSHGRGFAVVADEVRKLADRTSKATEEIVESISAIQDETNNAVICITAGTAQVDQGVAQADEMGQSLQQIVGAASHVAEMIESIAAAAREQSESTADVARSIEEIAEAASITADGSSKAQSGAFELARRVQSLRGLIGQFTVSATARPAADA